MDTGLKYKGQHLADYKLIYLMYTVQLGQVVYSIHTYSKQPTDGKPG